MHFTEPINPSPSYPNRTQPHNITSKNPINLITTNTYFNTRNSQNIIDRNSIPYLERDRDRERDRDKTIDQNYYNQKSTLSRIPHANHSNRYSYTNFVTLGNQDDVLLGIRERDGDSGSSNGELGVKVGRKIGRDAAEDEKDIGMYKKKIQVLVRDNQILVQAHRKLEIQTIKLRDTNKTLQFQIKSLLNQLTTQIKSSTTSQQTKQKPQNHPNNPQILPKTPSKHPPTPTPPPTSTSTPQNFQILIQNLQQQNRLLIQYKDSCLIKISQLEQNIQFIHTALERQRQENIYKGQKLKQMRQLHKQDMYNVKNMEKLIMEANNQLNMILKDAKSKEEQAGAVHEKFHKQMAKMKAKTDKYKEKMEQYRKQRDLLALQIQRAKIQIGTVTLRKYFPEDSDD